MIERRRTIAVQDGNERFGEASFADRDIRLALALYGRTLTLGAALLALLALLLVATSA